MKSEKNINLRVIGKKIDVTPALRDAAERSVLDINNYCDDNSTVTVALSVVGSHKHKVEVTAICYGNVMRVEKISDDMYHTILITFDAMRKKMSRYHNKISDRRAKNESIRVAESVDIVDDGPHVVRVKNFTLKPMSVDEACQQMDMLEHNFFVFLNAETNTTSVVYKRNDGNYGLIDPKME